MIAVIDYDAGNLTSVARALAYIGYSHTITKDVSIIERAERIIFPGVGAARSAMESLKKFSLDKAIKKAFAEKKPVLGICLGTQIIMSYSQENDNTPCLGIISGNVRQFPPDIKENGNSLKIPHMGWNQINIIIRHPVISHVRTEDEFYFVHGYYPAPVDADNVIAVTDYGIQFPSVIGFKNIIATQFHPEKSGKPGLELLKNFCEWNPC